MSHIQQLAKTGEQKQQPARGFDSYGLLACLVISIFLIVWITLASKSLNFGSVVFLFALPWVLLRAGAIVTAALRFPSFFALDFLLGVTVVSVAVMSWKFFVPVSLWVLLIVLLVAVASIPKLLPRHRRDPLSALGLLSVIVSLVAATGWSQDLIFPTTPLNGTVVFKPWSDFFIPCHFCGAQFGSRNFVSSWELRVEGLSRNLLSLRELLYPDMFGEGGISSSLCHRRRLLGAVRIVSHRIGQLCAWVEPFGVKALDLLALVATFLIPDAALLNIAHPTYGYFWLQHVAPGGLYAVAVAGIALILIAQGVREGRRAWIASGVVIGALVVFFKIQIFAAAFPLLVSFAIVGWPPRKQWQWLILGGCVAVGVALLPLANRFYIGPNVRFDLSGSVWYWQVLAKMARGTPVESWYRVFNDCSSISFTSAAGDRVTPY